MLDEGGRATTVLDGFITVLDQASDPEPLLKVVDVPMTLSGLSHYNVENALAAASAALGLGLPRAAVIEGLTSFAPNENNPGRMNMYSLRDFTVVIDLAHNEAGLEALLEIMNGVREPGGRLLLALGSPGDRADDMVSALGAIGARGADRVVIGHKSEYLRGRPPAELEEVFREGAASVGVDDVPAYPTELEAAQALVAEAKPGDVVAVMSLQDRASLDAWLRARGSYRRHTGDLEEQGRESPALAPSACGWGGNGVTCATCGRCRPRLSPGSWRVSPPTYLKGLPGRYDAVRAGRGSTCSCSADSPAEWWPGCSSRRIRFTAAARPGCCRRHVVADRELLSPTRRLLITLLVASAVGALFGALGTRSSVVAAFALAMPVAWFALRPANQLQDWRWLWQLNGLLVAAGLAILLYVACWRRAGDRRTSGCRWRASTWRRSGSWTAIQVDQPGACGPADRPGRGRGDGRVLPVVRADAA